MNAGYWDSVSMFICDGHPRLINHNNSIHNFFEQSDEAIGWFQMLNNKFYE